MAIDGEDCRESPLRVGVIGLGWLGTDLAGFAHDHDRTVVAALADVDEAARRTLGDELGVDPRSRYADHEAMIEEEDLDAAVITTPHRFHYDQIVAALDAGLHVLCEKPLCVDVERASDLASMVDAAGTTFMLGYQRHLNEAFRRARSTLRELDGEIRYVDAGVTQPWTDIAGDGWRAQSDLSGGGVLYDTGNHLIDGVLWTTGLDPAAVTAEMRYADDGVDVVSSVNVTFENGAVGSLSIDGTAPFYTEHNRVWTEDGGVEFDENGVERIDPDGDRHVPRIDRGREPNKIEAFVDAIDGGIDPPATVEDGVRAVALTEAAYEAARTGERVRVGR